MIMGEMIGGIEYPWHRVCPIKKKGNGKWNSPQGKHSLSMAIAFSQKNKFKISSVL